MTRKYIDPNRPPMLNTPIALLVKAMQLIREEKNLNLSELKRRAEQKGFKTTAYKIKMVSQDNFKDSDYVKILDMNFDVVLQSIGMKDIEFLNKAVVLLNKQRTKSLEKIQEEIPTALNKEILDWLATPECVKYVEYAHAIYKKKKIEEIL